MSERPLLSVAPEREEKKRNAPSRAVPGPSVPGLARQVVRLDPVFERLRVVTERAAAGQPILLQEDALGIEPERTVVFETAGRRSDFIAAFQRVSGLIVALEDEVDFEADDDFREPEGAAQVQGRLYAVIPDLRALQQIISLWNLFKAGQKLPRPFGAWTEFFEHLRDVRSWNAKDRVLSETEEYLRDSLEFAPNQSVRIEAQLWYRPRPEDRQRNLETVGIGRQGVALISECIIDEIDYHAVLLDIEPAHALQIVQGLDETVASAVGVMYLKPQSIVSVDDQAGDPEDAPPDAVSPEISPVLRIAVLDGLPLHRHDRLRGRVVIDDVDNFERTSAPASRSHGTAMCSLILNGDLHSADPLPISIYARPILIAEQANEEERTPNNEFPLDLVWRAVRRMKEGVGGDPPTAPDVTIINLSVGDKSSPFIRRAGPWARLVDYLSFKYRVLFVVSAGNHTTGIATGIATLAEFEALNDEQRAEKLIATVYGARAMRSLLSPAEAANALTVGACHSDGAPVVERRSNMSHASYLDADLPISSSAFGPGVRRAIKPDVVFDGGREYVTASPSPDGVYVGPSKPGRLFGHLCAVPGAEGRLDALRRFHGTSGAAALVTHNLAKALAVIDPKGRPELQVPEPFLAVVLKAMAVHAAQWTESAALIKRLIGPADPRLHARRRGNVAASLGFGRPDFDLIRECAANRAVMIYSGELEADRSLVFRLPIPEALEGLAVAHRIKLTVAWFSPINNKRAHHRAARLEVAAEDEEKWWIGTSETDAPALDQAANGTVVQLTLKGRNVLHRTRDDGLGVRVTCKAQHGQLREAVPFALMASFEIPVDVNIDIYEPIRIDLENRIEARANVRANG